ncbi:MAG: chromate transporter [Oscillospiraceae bacterium]|nr:chromate transporter [Oscillospiraceae bacterium]
MILFRLFVSFCIIGALAFGGGYAALPLIQEQCVETNHWLSMSEFSDLLTISQITPGPIAINSASFVGMKVAGIPGAVVASLGFMLPPFLIVSLIFILFKKYGKLTFMQNILGGLKPAVVGLIAVAALSVVVETFWGTETMSLISTDFFAVGLSVLAFVVLRLRKRGAMATIFACGAMGVLWELIAPLLRY